MCRSEAVQNRVVFTNPTAFNMSFTVSIEPSNISFKVNRDEAILHAAIAQGIGLPYGCKDGACGSCKCKIVQGRVIHGAHQKSALSAEEEAAGFTLTCCAAPQTDVVLKVRVNQNQGELVVRKMPTRVIKITKAAPDVAIIQLQLPATDPFRYLPGQYIEFILQDGARRSYSMASPPQLEGDKLSIELHIRHLPGGRFTDHVFNRLKEKDLLRMEGPFGSFFLRTDSEKPLVFVASGTGFAPIKAIIQQLETTASKRPAVLYWGGKRPVDLYDHEWVSCAAQKMGFTYIPVLSEADGAWQGRTGLVHEAVMADFNELSNHQVYACGAPVMVTKAQKDFVEKRQLPPQEFFSDAFTSALDLLKNPAS
jgi:CDP-4-dehydro-6-deoxyglucose reductase, E3